VTPEIPSIWFDTGRVLQVNTADVNPDGTPNPTAQVESWMTGDKLTLPLAFTAYAQNPPMPGWTALWVRFGRQTARPVVFWGAGEAFLRQGPFGNQAGEVQVQSAAGLGFMALKADGSARLVSGDNLASIVASILGLQLNSGSGITLNGTAADGTKGVQISVPGDGSLAFSNASAGWQFAIDPNGKATLSLQSLDVVIPAPQPNANGTPSTATPTPIISVDASGNTVLNLPSLTIKATNTVAIDAPSVLIGNGASGVEAVATFGGAVSGGPTGTEPVTGEVGTPVVGSAAVRISS
jgi:hypothetical protein